MRVLRSIFILALFGLTQAACTSERELAPLCPVSGDIPVVINPVFGDLQYDTSLNMAGLQQLKNSNSDIDEELLLGLTRTRSVVHSVSSLEHLTYPDGHACSYIKNIEVEIGYQELKVYIPHEIPEGSCGFDQIKTHELKHVSTAEAVLKEHLPLFYDKLRSYLHDNVARLQLNRTDGHDRIEDSVHRIQSNVEKILGDEFVAMRSELTAQQKQIDNPDEYQRVNTSCNGQLMSVAEDFRRHH